LKSKNRTLSFKNITYTPYIISDIKIKIEITIKNINNPLEELSGSGISSRNLVDVSFVVDISEVKIAPLVTLVDVETEVVLVLGIEVVCGLVVDDV